MFLHLELCIFYHSVARC